VQTRIDAEQLPRIPPRDHRAQPGKGHPNRQDARNASRPGAPEGALDIL
jgi:hypothetical protein